MSAHERYFFRKRQPCCGTSSTTNLRKSDWRKQFIESTFKTLTCAYIVCFGGQGLGGRSDGERGRWMACDADNAASPHPEPMKRHRQLQQRGWFYVSMDIVTRYIHNSTSTRVSTNDMVALGSRVADTQAVRTWLKSQPWQAFGNPTMSKLLITSGSCKESRDRRVELTLRFGILRLV